MLTTIDNPYDPYTQWDLWYEWDESHGYHTCSLLARMTNTVGYFTPEEEQLIMASAIEEIITNSITGNYILAKDPKPDSISFSFN